MNRGDQGPRRLLDRLPLALLHAALLGAVWPAAERPFSTPKLLVLAAGGAAALLLALLRPAAAPASAAATVALPAWGQRAAPALALGWLCLCALSALATGLAAPRALLLDLGAAALLLGLLHGRWSRAAAARALAALGAGLALWVLLQAAGLDPLAALAPRAPGRLRGYGTLGNPDFAAAWLGASLWLTLGEAAQARKGRPRAAWLAGAALQLVALGTARSFATLLALGAGAAAVLAVQPARAGPARRRLLLGSAALLAAAAALLPGLRGRDPAAALAGRLYLWRTGAAHLADAPLLGHGPGSVELLQPGWEAARWQRGEPAPSERRFAGRQDHLHQDLLERALEQGLPAALLFAALLFAGLAAARARALRAVRGRPAAAATLAALASLCARGLADFPAARPAELALLVTLVALAVRAAPARAAPADAATAASRPRPAPLPAPETP